MNQQVRRYLGAAAVLTLAATACASTGDPEVGDGDDSGTVSDSGYGGGDSTSGHEDAGPGYDTSTGYDTGTTTYDTGTGTDTGTTTGVCTPSCTSDTDCENSCPPAPSGGINCCDTSSGVCFANTSSTCPASGGNDP